MRIPTTRQAAVIVADLDPQANLTSMFFDESAPPDLQVAEDGNRLASMKHYRSLMPLAQEARKPMFLLRAADGAIGGHAQAVQDCYKDFRSLARTIAGRCGVKLP